MMNCPIMAILFSLGPLLLVTFARGDQLPSAAASTSKQIATSSVRTEFRAKIPVFPDPGEDTGVDCSRVDCTHYGSCLNCSLPVHCEYGAFVTANCTTLSKCSRPQQSVQKETVCRYCYQTDDSEHECTEIRNCSTSATQLFPTQCRVAQHVVCLGRRQFWKNVRCRWTNGYSWSKAMLLSVTLGGFGVDRFYLGLWKSGIGKLFSFGGLGIWTLVDILLIGVGYIQPADGSLYI